MGSKGREGMKMLYFAETVFLQQHEKNEVCKANLKYHFNVSHI